VVTAVIAVFRAIQVIQELVVIAVIQVFLDILAIQVFLDILDQVYLDTLDLADIQV